MTHYEIEADFLARMRESGTDTNEPICGDGKIHRFHVIGDKKGTKNGAYKLHCDGVPNGFWQSHKDGVIVRYKADSTQFAPLTHAQKTEFEAKKKAEQRATQLKYEQAATVAREIAAQARTIQHPHEHPYLIAKRLKSAHNALILTGDLILLYWNEQRELSTVQFIAPNSEKRYLKGGKKTGCFGFIGTPTPRILISEGFATAASLHEDTGSFCIFAGDAGNLESVARVIRKLYPENQITICGDNDISGVGQAAAKKAAIACGGAWIVPVEAGKDFNDVITGGGIDD